MKKLMNRRAKNRRRQQAQYPSPMPIRHSPMSISPSAHPVSKPSYQFRVQGRVLDAEGSPFSNGIIRAYDVKLRTEYLLGETTTDDNGRYSLGYVPNTDEVSLRVTAFDKYNKKLDSSPVNFCAGNDVISDLYLDRNVYRGISEFERLEAQLIPPLRGSSLVIADLTEDEKHDDITFLSGKTGIPTLRIAFFSLANRLQRKTGLRAEIYFGLLSQGIPTQLQSILRQSPEAQRRALEAAIRENIIPFRFGKQLDDVISRLRKLLVREALEPVDGGRSTTTGQLDGMTSVGQLLKTVLPDRTKQEIFLSEYIKYTDRPITEFWKSLKSKREFRNYVKDLEFTFQLAALTLNHMPLVQELQRRQRSGEFGALSDLSRFSKEDWLEIISRPRHVDDGSLNHNTSSSTLIGFPSNVPGNNDREKAANYAQSMAQMIEDISPTSFIARRIERDNGGGYFGDMPGKQDLLTFLIMNPEFDLKYGRLESYLADKPNVFEKISDVEGTKSRIKTMQRLYKVAPNCDHIRVLMKAELGSAHAIARMSENTFVREYGEALGGSTAAKVIHERAMDVQAKAISIFAEHGIASYKVPMSVLPDAVQTNVEGIPEWSTLFGSLDLCMCEHCNSVYSPAAYLVDLLRFLNDRLSKIRKGKKRFKTVKEVLFERRADIGDIGLTCENVNTPLPYVDLVNEILENAVWRFRSFSPFTLASNLEADLNRQTVSKELRNAFSPPLSPGAIISICGQGEPWAPSESCWSIDDLPFTYTIRKERTDNKPEVRVVSRSFQTKGSAPERGAKPQYINTRAYEVLRRSVFPWSLPFHYWDEEARTYLGHLDVTRHQIMEAFLGGDRRMILNNPILTREHLGISAEEANIITGVTKSQPDDDFPGVWNPGVWNLWGFEDKTLSFQHSISDPSDTTRRITSGDWFETITQRVDVFLQQSGLKYQELLELLDTVFINPLVDEGDSSGGEDGGKKVRTIQISSNDPKDPLTCEIAKLQLNGLTKRGTALKIMRFARLWRRMAANWTMRDLDRVITALGVKKFDYAFISQLSHILRLCLRLNIPVDNVITFWAPINTASYYVDHNAPGRPKVPSLYAHLFRNKSVSEILDPAFPEDPEELDKLNRTLSKHARTISNSLRISTAEFQLFLGSLNVIPSSTPGGTNPDDKLNLKNLSLLYRHSILAKALKIPIRDYISLLELVLTATHKPFDSTADTLLFVEDVDKVNASPVSIPELNYLLLPPPKGTVSISSSPSSPIGPTEDTIAAILDEIRIGLQRIAAENAFSEDSERNTNVDVTTDSNGSLTRQKLALLHWDSALIERILSTLNGTLKYQAPLSALPSELNLAELNDTGIYKVHLESLPDGFSFPPELADSIRYDSADREIIASRFFSVTERALLRKASSDESYKLAIDSLFALQDDPGLEGTISYDQDSQRLEFVGIMTRIRLNRLKGAVANKPANRPYREAIDSIYDAPRKFVSRQMHTFSVRNFSTELAALPSGVQFSDNLKDKVYFDTGEEPPRLHFIGVMTEDERNLLLELSAKPTDPNDAAYRSAVKSLFNKAESYKVHLESLPDGFSFPPELADSIRYDSADREIIASRFFSVTERDLLRKASSDESYKLAIDSLFALQGGWLLDNTSTSEERFLRVLKRLLPHLQQILSESFVKQKIAESLNLEYRVADKLLMRYVTVNSSSSSQNKSIAAFVPTSPDLIAKSFVESNPNIKLTRRAFPDQFNTFTLLHKIAIIIAKLEISERQLVWIFEYGPKRGVGWLDLNKLPISTEDKPASFDKWLRLLDLFRLRDGLPSGELILDELFNLAGSAKSSLPANKKALDKILKALSENTKWDLTDLKYLVGEKVFNFTALDFRNERPLTRLWDCFLLIKGLKMSARQCRDLAETDDPSLPKKDREKRREERSRSLRQTVKARYDGGDGSEEQWLKVAKPLRDLLREKQRGALVEYLVAHLKIRLPILERPHPTLSKEMGTIKKHKLAVKELQRKLNAAGSKPTLTANGIFRQRTHNAVVYFQNANRILPANGVVGPETWSVLDTVRRTPRNKNDLYAHYLIDVEMSPCMMTSRIKQAISSIQLFVQRCFMNLEEGVEASITLDERWGDWDWMKNYGVWEGQRKLFLYPENWIRPELRDDKSPFFKEFESQLLEGDLTDELAESALLSYLTKLDQVAMLEIVGTYHQKERGIDILHIFGRTLDVPHVYYYRKLLNSTHWGPWEKVDLEIEGNHLAPIVWNRRLYLFWITFMLKTRAKWSDEPGEPPEEEKYYELKVAWSERQENKWAAKKQSSTSMDFFYWDPSLVAPFPADVGLGCRINPDNNLEIVLFEIASVRSKRYGSRLFRFNACNSDPGLEVVDDDTGWAYAPFNTIFNYNFVEEIPDLPFYLPASSNIETSYLEVLHSTPGNFRLLPPHDITWLYDRPSFYMDNTRSFLISPREEVAHERYWWQADGIDPALVFGTPMNGRDGLKPFQRSTIPHIAANPQAPLKLTTSFLQTSDLDKGNVKIHLPHAATTTPIKETKGATLGANANYFTKGGNVPSPNALTIPNIMATTFTLSDSVGLKMRSNPSIGNSTVNYFPAFTDSVQRQIKYRFKTFYHPFVCSFVRVLNQKGIEGLYQRSVQTKPHTFLPVSQDPFDFKTSYVPTTIVSKPYPVEKVDFKYGNPYALYNWELFFHCPLLIADRLGKNQRFAEAQKWLHRIFDPTGISEPDYASDQIPQRYWRTKPFYDTTREDYQKQRIQILLKLLAVGNDPLKWAELSDDEKELLEEFRNSIDEWRKNPFKPHLIARMRSTAYQKTVVSKYIDILIAWADQLFRRETIESINEATQLYILAAEILGRRPEELPARAAVRVQTYNDLEPKLDEFSNALIQIEDLITPSSEGSGSSGYGGQGVLVTLPTMLYFCVPKNDELLKYWDIVGNRLFKIRHCMNIQGTIRQLPLYELPIDPALLVKAASAGIDISSLLNDINTAPPYYRFNLLAQKASELCSELKSLGSALLAALEKKDAEELALLRAGHETTLLKEVELVKEQQYDEAAQNQIALRKSRDVSVARYMYYQKLLGVQDPKVPGEGESIPDLTPSPQAKVKEERSVKVIQQEINEMDHMELSNSEQNRAFDRESLARFLHLIPNIEGGPLFVTMIFGGSFLGSAMEAFAGKARAKSAEHSFRGSMASKMGQYIMRAHEWGHQSNLAAREIMQIDKQIEAAEIRKQIASKELSNHFKQIENARQVEDFMRSKYTNQELYSWMVGQISSIYFQSYQLAYDVAKRAETAYRFELGLNDSNFIRFGYWDSLKQGLLAGERLYHDIKRMEVAFLDQNQREYEVTKHVSLSRLDPLALAQLKQTGECFVSVPEALFDLDYPGHYLRRIKYVSLTVPCVTGPYTGVNCTLTLLKSSIRYSSSPIPSYLRQQDEEDPRFSDSHGAIQSIVTSSGQNDSGLFETNLRDERYLPFEGSGVIGEWRIQLPRDFRPFNFGTISDVVLHLRYTARDGGEPLKNQAVTELNEALNEFMRTEGQNGLALPISLRHEFPSEWHRFLNPPADNTDKHTLPISLGPERFPFMFQGKPIMINWIETFLKVKPEYTRTHNEKTLKLTLEPEADPSSNSDELDLVPWNGLLRAVKAQQTAELGIWTLTGWLEPVGGPLSSIDPKAIEDVLVVCNYSL